MPLILGNRRSAFALPVFAAAFSAAVRAQSVPAAPAPAAPASAPASAAAASAPRATTLAPVIVTGNPLGSREIASPVSVLTGDELVRRRGSSLGETLNGQPGVSSTYFGPNANRPIIRGLDGDRLRILNNSGSLLDASSLSFDHAVAIDPLAVERIEVLRGPGALLYGGNAIGGVVNAIDNRIPKYSLQGVSGAGEVRFGGAESERGGSALIEAGNGDFAVHADAFGRKTSDLHVPRYTPVDAEGNALERTGRVRNSQSDTDGGALGASYTFRSGYFGVSADRYDSKYGVVAEEDVTIRLKRDHYALAGEVRDLGGPLRTIRAQVNNTRYKHEEIEGSGEIGTTFRTKGTELRVEAEHVAIGPLKGVVGAQFERFDFSALGEEAFVPKTTTRRGALFLVEEYASSVGTLNAGLRIERARLRSDGDADPAEMKFGPPVQRSFTLRSASLSDVYKFAPEWSVTGSFSSTARAPTYYELFANGVHAATGTFEVGDTGLGIERGNNVDIAVEWKSGRDRLRAGVYQARFSRYISLQPTGATITEPGDDGSTEDFPEYAFRAVRARLSGVEIDGSRRVFAGGGWTLDASGKIDYTRATNRSTGEPLPRIAPLRTSVALDAGWGQWLGRVEVEYAARQNRTPSYDSETGSYTLVNLIASRRMKLGGFDAYAFLKATNLGDRLGYSASTIETIRGLVPVAGRAVKVGLRVAF